MNKKYQKVLVHGNFEILHTGHIRLFHFSKEVAEYLVVAMFVANIDSSEIHRRLEQLDSIPLIDEVITYSNIESLVSELKPDLILMGREFAELENIEESLTSKYGGKVIYSSGENEILKSSSIPHLFSPTSLVRDSAVNFMRRNKISLSNLRDTVKEFKNQKILIVGDVIVDEFIECLPLGLSQESSSMVVKPISSRKFLGGAGIVAGHCASLGANVTILTILGSDNNADEARKFMNEYSIKLNEVFEPHHPTVLKQRFKQGNQTLFRLNHFRNDGISKLVRYKFSKKFEEIFKEFNAVIFSDFSYGVFDSEDVPKWVNLAKKNGAFVSADSQTSSQVGDITKFQGANLICPTEREARLEIRDPDGLIVLSQKLMNKVESEFVFLKLGADGVLLNGKNIKTDHIPALNDVPLDSSGAGDSLIATATLTFSVNENHYVAAFLGSLAAAIQVSRVGNQPISSSDLMELIEQLA